MGGSNEKKPELRIDRIGSYLEMDLSEIIEKLLKELQSDIPVEISAT